MSIARHHADWLQLVENSGPFVSLKVLQTVFPQGLEPRDTAKAAALRSAYKEWQAHPDGLIFHRNWILHVLTELLAYPAALLAEGQAIPPGLEARMPEMGETLRPDFALLSPAESENAGQAQLLITVYPVGQSLEKPVAGKIWKASAATRMMELLHGAGVPLGLVTNGEHWMLVYAPPGEATGYASWYGYLWMEEAITLRAFHSLLGVRRFFGVSAENTLLGLLRQSANDQQEVTDQLGYQVREAVEVLVQSFDTLDRESHRTLLAGVSETSIYEAALTVMMRLVFLFSAEERGLLHLGKPLYDENYAVSTLLAQLQEVADYHTEDVLERRTDAWARLLSTFRAVHGGVQHQDLSMQAYGGSLFDPDRYPFLEGRPSGTQWRTTPSSPLAVNNRVVLHLLSSLQRLRSKSGSGSNNETRRVSFRALGVEQIGHVYEGLLDHTAVRAMEPVLGIRGTRKQEPEIPLSKLESLLTQGQDKLVDFLEDQTGRSAATIRKSLNDGGLLDTHKLRIACGQDDALLARLVPFVGLIREDSFERPLVVLSGSVYVTAGTTRRSTGTHYTPPSLTEPIVQYTMEPLVYEGPAEGWPREHWKLKSPTDILALRVCDMAMGSGAFLVQVCRYLAERLVESWDNAEKLHPGEILVSPEGIFSAGSPAERLVPSDVNERIAVARRVIADRCLYGVDINPMAVEMAKLSIWLITVDTNRAFTFLNHAFKTGDSLLGVDSFKQIEDFSLRADASKQHTFSTINLWRHVEEAQQKRTHLAAMPSDTPEQIAAKSVLHLEAEEAVAKLKAVADILIGIELKGLKGSAYEKERAHSADLMMLRWTQGLEDLKLYARQKLGAQAAFHWALVFPEIVKLGGFHAFVGNPPFMGGLKLETAFGAPWRSYLVTHVAKGIRGTRGTADLSAYFLLRASRLVRNRGVLGLITTNTIAQGDSREVGLNQLVKSNYTIFRALPSAKWPGQANLEIAQIWVIRGPYEGNRILNGASATSITSMLTEQSGESNTPLFELSQNKDLAFVGALVVGMGFILNIDEAESIVKENPECQSVIFKYLNGDDLNSSPTQSPSRRVINFLGFPLNRETAPINYDGPVAADFPKCLEIVQQRVFPERMNYEPKNPWNRKLRSEWWLFGQWRWALATAIAPLKRVLVRSRVASINSIAFAPTDYVFSDAVVVFAFDDMGHFALLQSFAHTIHLEQYASSLRNDVRYTPSSCFNTFPRPQVRSLEDIGESYYGLRPNLMESRQVGLTKIYTHFHNPMETSAEIKDFRRAHEEMDYRVAVAFGWSDLALGHGFHDTKFGLRYTISEAARQEVLHRLVTLNRQQRLNDANPEIEQTVRGAIKPSRTKNTTRTEETLSLFE